MTQRNKSESSSRKQRKIPGGALVAVLLVCAVVIAIGVGATIAYFTDKTEVENVFTFGDVDIIPREPNFPPDNPPVTPNEETPKDPMITNTGSQAAIVFMEVQVPVEDVILVDANGGLNSEYFDTNGAVDKTKMIPEELFWFNSDAAATETVGENTYNSKWILLSKSEEKTAGGYVTYLFGYTNVLAASDEPFNSGSNIDEFPNTESLFDRVRMKNYLEGTLDTSKVYNILINTYAIQAAYLSDQDGYIFNDSNENGVPAADRVLTKDNLQEIWTIYAAQTQPSA